MPAKSKSQQKYFGMVHAIQKGELDPHKVSPHMQETAQDMNTTSVNHFAETKHKGLPAHIKKAFTIGFMKRACAAKVNPNIAQAWLDKSANEFVDLMHMAKEQLYPGTHDSMMSIADKIAPETTTSSHKTLHEILAIGKHMGSHGIAPGLAGAGLGALGGAAVGKSGERGKAARKGALWGGALGFGSGVYNDGSHLVDNTKDRIIDSAEERISRRSNDHSPEADGQTREDRELIDNIKNHFWRTLTKPQQ